MNNILKKQIYKNLCLKKELTTKEYSEYNLFIKSGGTIGLIQNTCCYCDKELSEENFFIITSYWNPIWKPCCSENCAKEGYKIEEINCQEIDTNCNECKYFERKGFSENTLPQTHNIIQPIGCYIGICRNKKSKYYNKFVGANRNTFQGMSCFVNRKEIQNDKN